jgi:hypothetical protein
MLVVRAPTWMPRVRNGSWLTSGPTDRAGHGQIGAFAQDARVQQRGDLAVHRRDAQLGGFGDHVSGDRSAGPHGTEHRSPGGVGDAQRRGDDVVT